MEPIEINCSKVAHRTYKYLFAFLGLSLFFFFFKKLLIENQVEYVPLIIGLISVIIHFVLSQFLCYAAVSQKGIRIYDCLISWKQIQSINRYGSFYVIIGKSDSSKRFFLFPIESIYKNFGWRLKDSTMHQIIEAAAGKYDL